MYNERVSLQKSFRPKKITYILLMKSMMVLLYTFKYNDKVDVSKMVL